MPVNRNTMLNKRIDSDEENSYKNVELNKYICIYYLDQTFQKIVEKVKYKQKSEWSILN